MPRNIRQATSYMIFDVTGVDAMSRTERSPGRRTNSHTMRDGWNIGAGAEYAWINNWMVGVEYRQLTRR